MKGACPLGKRSHPHSERSVRPDWVVCGRRSEMELGEKQGHTRGKQRLIGPSPQQLQALGAA